MPTTSTAVVAPRSESAAARKVALGDVRVHAVMTPDPAIAPAAWTVAAFLAQIAHSAPHHAYPVLDRSGRPAGLLTLGTLETVAPQDRDALTVGRVALGVDCCVVVEDDERVVDVLSVVNLLEGDEAIVVVREGRVCGLLTPRDLDRIARVAALVGTAPHVNVGRRETANGDWV